MNTVRNKNNIQKRVMRHLLLWILGFFIAVSSLASFVFVCLMARENSIALAPKIHEIATDSQFIFAIDNRFRFIQKYDLNGKLIWFEPFYEDHYENRIFCDRSGNLCRLNVSKNTVYVYDDKGTIISQYSATLSDLISNGVLDELPQTEVSISEDLHIEFNDQWIADSVLIVHQENESIVIVVESMRGHLIETLVWSAFWGGFTVSAYHTLRFFLVAKGASKNKNMGKKTGDTSLS